MALHPPRNQSLQGSRGDPLGFATVHPPAGTIGLWNCEMEADDFDDYLVRHVTDTGRIAVAHLRGHPMAWRPPRRPGTRR